MRKDLTILELKLDDDDDDDYSNKIDERLLKPHFNLLLLAPTNSGKSFLINNLMYNNNFYSKYFNQIYYISATLLHDKSCQHIRHDNRENVYKIYENLDELDIILKNIIDMCKEEETIIVDDKEQKRKTLLVLDDMLPYLKKSKTLSHLLTYNRHLGISIIISSQNLRSVPPSCRANIQGVIIFKITNKKELKKIEDEYGDSISSKEKSFIDIYNDAINEKYNFLFIDLKKTKAYKNFTEILFEK